MSEQKTGRIEPIRLDPDSLFFRLHSLDPEYLADVDVEPLPDGGLKWINPDDLLPEDGERVLFSEYVMVWAGHYTDGLFWDYCSGEGAEPTQIVAWAKWPAAPDSWRGVLAK